MPDYSVSFARSARRDLERLETHVARRIIARIESLAANPRPRGVVKLQGDDDLWRIRIGDYRVVYLVDDATKVVDINAVRHRSDVYR